MKKRTISKTLLAAIALAMLGTGCGDKSGKPQPARTGSAAAVANPLTIVLAYQGNTNRTDVEIRQRQEQIRAGKQTGIALERLGWLFVAKARESFDAGFYKLAEQCALAMERDRDASARNGANGDEGVAATHCAAMLLRAHVLQNLHRFAESEAVARELVEARGLAFDYGVLGDALMEQGKLDEAVAAYQQMADLKPDSQAFTRAAHFRWLRGDLAGAIEMMEFAVSAVSMKDTETAAWVFTRLAALKWQATGQRSLSEARPLSGPLPRGEGESFAAGSEFERRSLLDAHTIISERSNAVPSPGGEGQGEGGRLHTLPDFIEVEQDLQTALTLRSNYAPALLLCGKMLMAQNKFAEAFEPLRVAEQQNPLPEYQWALADALETAGRSAEARTVESRLHRTGASADPRSFALFLATRGEKSELALRLAHEELTTRADVFTHDAVAWAQFAQRNLAEAQLSMDCALAEGTQDSRLFMHAAIIAAKAGQTDRAEQYFHKADALSHLLLPSERKQLRTVAAQLNQVRTVLSSRASHEESSVRGKSF